MGKPLVEAKIEMQVAIDLLRWYGEEGKRVYGRIIPSRIPNMEHEARKVPVGPVLAFVAWNFPATNVMRKVAGALAAGCSIKATGSLFEYADKNGDDLLNVREARNATHYIFRSKCRNALKAPKVDGIRG